VVGDVTPKVDKGVEQETMVVDKAERDLGGGKHVEGFMKGGRKEGGGVRGDRCRRD